MSAHGYALNGVGPQLLQWGESFMSHCRPHNIILACMKSEVVGLFKKIRFFQRIDDER